MGPTARAAYARVMNMDPRCQTCGAELHDPYQRWCGGDRCARVFAPAAGGAIGYTGSYREPSAGVVSVSVVSVLEARGPE